MTEITIKAKKLKGWEKFVGLIGKESPEAVYFETRWGIHTFGLKFPIDVMILDKENKIVLRKKNLKPNRVFFWNSKYDKVLELPVNKYQLKIGQIISLS